MLNSTTKFNVSAPGRVCLFGEHQDYLNLPVIPCAISLRINIHGEKQTNNLVHLDLPDIKSEEEFMLNGIQNYHNERDYFKSALNVLQKNQFTFSEGFRGEVNGKIPINSGTSSSSALIVAWIKTLTQLSDQNTTLSAEEIAAFAFKAEVEEFNEPGGKMDMYSSAIGGTIFLDFEPELKVTKLNSSLKSIVLGDSGEPKKTTEILARVKDGVIEILELLKRKDPNFRLRTTNLTEIEKYKNELNDVQFNLLAATITNFQITLEAKNLLTAESIDHLAVGKLLSLHHEILNSDLQISTPKIERMIKASIEAGAYGAKINGSGGGGCMFAYAPEDPVKVAKAIESAGGKAYIITPDVGVN